MAIDSEPIHEEVLATRRSRRSTAGNRMQAAMAEMEVDTSFNEQEDDADYTNEKVEEDIFDVDFESTDEELDAEDGDAGLREEERRVHKLTKVRLEKATEAAHIRNKATFDPNTGTESTVVSAVPKRLQRHSEAGESSSQRQSGRKQTVLNTTLSHSRLRMSQERRANGHHTLKRPRILTQVLSQAELIARALDSEEGNIVAHRDYLKNEEERRKQTGVVRPVVEGPLLRWRSRAEPDGPGSDSKHVHNYVVHEESQELKAKKPGWEATMTAMFGDHVDWTQVKVYSGKNRPMSRVFPICPLTGRPAPYRDPRTGVPFTDAQAFQQLTAVLESDQYVWSEQMGAYI